MHAKKLKDRSKNLYRPERFRESNETGQGKNQERGWKSEGGGRNNRSNTTTRLPKSEEELDEVELTRRT